MKKTAILLLFVGGLTMFSCKKTYTCDCTLVDHYDDGDTSYTVNSKNTSVAYSAKMTKKQAQAACDHEAEAAKDNISDISFQSGSFDDSFSATCTLK